MKKKFVALLMSAVMVSGSLALPVYAAEEETAIEFADDEEDTVDVEEEPEESEEQEDTGVSEIPEDTWEDFSDQPVTEDFSSESEAVGTSTTLGGNINWGSQCNLANGCNNSKNWQDVSGDKGKLYYRYAECFESNQCDTKRSM